METERAYAFVAGRVRAEWVEKTAGNLVRRTHFEAHWDARRAEPMVFEQVALYGLTLIARRRVRFAPVSREGAREVFVRSGLVENGYACGQPFMERNARELARLRTVEHKLRAPGAVVSEDAIFAFYDARVPSHVVDGRTFEEWFSGLDDDGARAFELTRKDIAPGVPAAREAEFPDTLRIDDGEFALAYRFAPGEDDDGLTVSIPLDVLVNLDPGRFEWLVPGMLAEKVLALLRALPKSLRRTVMPLAGVGREFIARACDQNGSLHDSLARHLDRTRGVSVPRDAWSPARLRRVLAAHLLMRFEVTDGDGEVLARGRHLDEIERRLAGPRETRTGPVFVRGERGHASWTFGAVPVEVEDRAEAGSGVVFPAIRDIGSGVLVEHFQARAAAERSHRAGLVRLFALAMRREARECLRALPGIDELCLLYAMIAPPPDWVDPPSRDPGGPDPGTGAEARRDLVDRTVARVFVVPSGAIRERSRFEAVLGAGRSGFADGLAAAIDGGLEILRAARAVRGLIDSSDLHAPPESLADARRQLDGLVHHGFLASTPEEAFPSLPRYLRALRVRLEKLARRRGRTTPSGSRRSSPCSSAWNRRCATPGPAAGAIPSSRATDGCWRSTACRCSPRSSAPPTACRGRSSTSSGPGSRRSEPVVLPLPHGEEREITRHAGDEDGRWRRVAPYARLMVIQLNTLPPGAPTMPVWYAASRLDGGRRRSCRR